jgi:hypothetical protein
MLTPSEEIVFIKKDEKSWSSKVAGNWKVNCWTSKNAKQINKSEKD